MNEILSKEHIRTSMYTISATKGKSVNVDKHYEWNVRKLKQLSFRWSDIFLGLGKDLHTRPHFWIYLNNPAKGFVCWLFLFTPGIQKLKFYYCNSIYIIANYFKIYINYNLFETLKSLHLMQSKLFCKNLHKRWHYNSIQ